MSVQENIQLVENLKKEVKSHCMCADFQEDKYHFMIIYPPGFSIDGVRISVDIGKAKALNKLLSVMEKEWQDSLFWKK